MDQYVKECIPPYWHFDKIWQIRNALKKFFIPETEKPNHVVDMCDRLTRELESNKVPVKDFIEEKIKTFGDWSRFAQLYEKHCTRRHKKPNIICRLVLQRVPKVDPTFRSILTSINDEMSKHNLTETGNKDITD